MALTKEELAFTSSIENKIKKYNIRTTLKEAIGYLIGQLVYTIYNTDGVELVDAGIEMFLVKKSFSYFLNEYSRVDVPGLGTIEMNPYYFQTEVAKELMDYRKIVLDKTRQCLTEDNFVMTNRGYISIKDVKVGDKVETVINNKSHFVTVERFYDNGKKKVCRILTNSGAEVMTTLDHLILTEEGYKEARLLTLSDKIITLVNNGSFGSFKLEDDKHAALIGYYLADGKASQPIFVNTNLDYINEVLEAGETFENCHPYIYNRPLVENRKQGYDLRLVSKTKGKLYRPILSFMNEHNLNKKSIDRILTTDLMNLNKKQMSILLNRLFAGDGYITYNKDKRRPNYIQYEIGIGAPNYTLLKQLEYILQTKYGIHCWIQEQFGKKQTQRFWKIRISQKKSVLKFIDEIGIKGKTDTKEIIELISKEKPYNSNQPFNKIRKIQTLEEPENVYDITTATSNFLSNCLVVHNSGLSTIFALYSFWRAHFFPAESIDVVSVKQKKAQQFVKKIYSTMNSLPEWMKTPIKYQNQQEITFIHGKSSTSTILSESQSDNAGRGDSLSVLILDEVAFYQSERMARNIIASAQPTLNKTGGQLILISCVVGDTYIYTDSGLEQVKDYKPKNCKLGYNEIPEFKIDGINHQQECNTFYDSGITDIYTVETSSGFKISGSPIHPMMINKDGKSELKMLKDIKVGDNILSSSEIKYRGCLEVINYIYTPKRNTEKYINIKKIDNDLSYLIGIYIAEGYIDKTKYKISIACTEDFIIKKISNICNKYNFSFKFYNGRIDIFGKGFVLLFNSLGYFSTTAKYKTISKGNLKLKKTLMISLLQGMFDGDGCNNYKNHSVDYTSYSYELLYQLKMILLSFGIHSFLIKKSNTLRIYSHRKKFLEKIGFSLPRKQNYNNIDEIRENSYLKESTHDNILLSGMIDNTVLSVIKEKSQKNTYDFTIPESKSFYANGLLGSNTPNGVAGKGAYYYEQVTAARAGSKDTKYLEIDWWEVPDDEKIKGPKKGYNDILDKAVKEGYYYKPEIKKKYNEFFKPIARETYLDNEWLKAAHDDLNTAAYRQEILHDFIVAGDKVFSEEILSNVEERLREPITKDVFGTSEYEGWWIWKKPIPGHRYIAGIDVSSGTGKDFSTMEILDVAEYEQVAEYKGHMSTPNFARFIKKAAIYYNEAYLAIECNSIGEAIFNGVYYSEIDPYQNVYKQKKTKNGITRMTGWTTDVKTRKLLTNDFIDWITVPELFDSIKIYSKRLWMELSTWIWAGGNKPEHSGGSNDDTIISLALALYLRNKAINSGESFLITDDGEVIESGSKDNSEDSSLKRVAETFDVLSSDTMDNDDFEDSYGCSKEDYEWLIGTTN